MSRQIGDTSDRVALDLDIGRVHLSYQGRETAELDDEDLVVACNPISTAFCIQSLSPMSYHLLPSSLARRLLLFGLRYLGFRGDREWVRECSCRRA